MQIEKIEKWDGEGASLDGGTYMATVSERSNWWVENVENWCWNCVDYYVQCELYLVLESYFVYIV